jgi:predicted nucleic acid-binding protein
VIVGIDTSVVVRVLTGEPRELALLALDYLLDREKAGDRVLVSDLVLAEAYYALQHHYGASKKEALNALVPFWPAQGSRGRVRRQR